MADFFNNLLLRSSASGKASGAVLQPRLPSLFESHPLRMNPLTPGG